MNVDLLYEYLDEAELTQYYSQFKAKNLTLSCLNNSTLQEIGSLLGITSKTDRRKLFELIQLVKKASTESPIPNYSSTLEEDILQNLSPLDSKYYGLEKQISNFESTPIEEDEDEYNFEQQENVYKSPNYITPQKSKKNLSNLSMLSTTKSPSLKSPSLKTPIMMKTTPISKTPKSEMKSTSKKSNLSKICVAIRKRPLNSFELKTGASDIVPVKNEVSLVVQEPKQKLDLTKYTEQHKFMFDEVFTEMDDNEAVYQRTAQPLVYHVFNGGNATCFAYGQTGSGKTHTMMGKGNVEGIYLLASKDIFNMLDSSMNVTISFFEIYGGKSYDLLNEKKRLFAREDSSGMVNIVGIKHIDTKNVQELMKQMESGNKIRSTGSTGVNSESSRSHAVLQITVNKESSTIGKFSFIDLAGSERGVDTRDNDKQTRIEGAEINKSLLALKECFRSLASNKKHIPFRGSKLTEVLKDSFIGNSKTCMIANISPSSHCCEHTLNTLRYADRVKEFSKGSNEDDVLKARDKRNEESYLNTPLLSPTKDFAPQSDLCKIFSKRNDSQFGVDENFDDDDVDTDADEMYVEDNLEMQHEIIINRILEQEEEIIECHQQKIDNTMRSVKKEMTLLESFSDPNSNISHYISSMDSLLLEQMQDIIELRKKLGEFQKNVETEKKMNELIEKK